MKTTMPAHRLRWYQNSPRSLFVLHILLAIAGNWFSWKCHRAETQRQAVEWIREMGGFVEYDCSFDATGRLIGKRQPPAPAWLRAWLGDDYFANIHWVRLDDTRAADAGLHRLERLTQLKLLNLSNTQVTDAGLKHLKGLTQLQTLELSDIYLTDVGLEHLKGLNQLKYLFLANTSVTDAGLEHLKGMVHLEDLYVENTAVTDEGIRKLQKALPNCKIRRWHDSP